MRNELRRWTIASSTSVVSLSFLRVDREDTISLDRWCHTFERADHARFRIVSWRESKRFVERMRRKPKGNSFYHGEIDFIRMKRISTDEGLRMFSVNVRMIDSLRFLQKNFLSLSNDVRILIHSALVTSVDDRNVFALLDFLRLNGNDHDAGRTIQRKRLIDDVRSRGFGNDDRRC